MTPLAEPLPHGLTYRLVLTADVSTIRIPRKLAEAALIYWNLPHLCVAVTTVASELVTNAGKQVPGTEIKVALHLRDGWLRLEVWDCSDDIPQVPAELDLDAEGGRGLWVVAHLADKFGIDPAASTEGSGKTIWAMWSADAGTAAGDPA